VVIIKKQKQSNFLIAFIITQKVGKAKSIDC